MLFGVRGEGSLVLLISLERSHGKVSWNVSSIQANSGGKNKLGDWGETGVTLTR